MKITPIEAHKIALETLRKFEQDMLAYRNNDDDDGASATIELIPEMLRAMREKRDLTLREVSELTNLSVSFLSDLERGRTRPSLGTLERLATAYQQTITVDIPFKRPPNNSL